MRFSLAFLHAAMVWCTVLMAAIFATMQVPQTHAEHPAQVVCLLMILLLAYSAIGFVNDSSDSKPYWSGYAITSVLLILYFLFLMPSERNRHLWFGLAEWVYTQYREATGIPSGNASGYTYMSSLSVAFAYWLIPVFSYFGGQLGMRFKRKQTDS